MLTWATGPGPGCGLRKPATAAKRFLGLRALGRRGWAVEPELEVARSPFKLWAPVLLTGKPCRTAELQPVPLRALHLGRILRISESILGLDFNQMSDDAELL